MAIYIFGSIKSFEKGGGGRPCVLHVRDSFGTPILPQFSPAVLLFVKHFEALFCVIDLGCVAATTVKGGSLGGGGGGVSSAPSSAAGATTGDSWMSSYEVASSTASSSSSSSFHKTTAPTPTHPSHPSSTTPSFSSLSSHRVVNPLGTYVLLVKTCDEVGESKVDGPGSN